MLVKQSGVEQRAKKELWIINSFSSTLIELFSYLPTEEISSATNCNATIYCESRNIQPKHVI